MTKEELLAVKRHSRIKYIGMDPAVLEQIKQRGPATASTKGMIADYISDYSTSRWGDDQKQGICIRTWNSGRFTNIKPEDWIIVDDRRVDLERSREKRQIKGVDKSVRSELSNFTKQFMDMKHTKQRIDKWLDGIPLTARLTILTTLTDEQKAWLQLISMDPEEVISMLKKIVDADPEEVNGSNGQDVPVPTETPVCPS